MWKLFLGTVILSLGLSKSTFYEVIASDLPEELAKLEIQIVKIKDANLRKAYSGTVKMKQSKYRKTPKDKIALFKEGKALLETAINEQPKNVEFRFLRLLIQEHVPKILKYSKEIEKDCAFIQANLSAAPSDLKKIIENYADNSDHLNL